MLHAKSPVPLWAVLIVGAVGILAVYVAGQPRQSAQSSLVVKRATSTAAVSTSQQPATSVLASPTPTPAAAPIPSGWKTYEGEPWASIHVHLEIPAEWHTILDPGRYLLLFEGKPPHFFLEDEYRSNDVSYDDVLLGSPLNVTTWSTVTGESRAWVRVSLSDIGSLTPEDWLRERPASAPCEQPAWFQLDGKPAVKCAQFNATEADGVFAETQLYVFSSEVRNVVSFRVAVRDPLDPNGRYLMAHIMNTITVRS